MEKQLQLCGAFFGVALLLCGTVMAAEATSDTGKHLFILSGQSNMREPLPSSFTKAVSQVFGKDKVLVAMFGRPSQPIKQWYKLWAPPAGSKAVDLKTNGQMYNQLLETVKRKISGQKLASVTFIWMQGEADAEAGWGKVYEQSFYGILDQFKKDLDLKKINFVVGRINDYWLPSRKIVDGDIVRAVQVKMGESNENGAWVDTDDLNTGVNPWNCYEIDGGHFPNPGYRVLGERFARKACRLIDPQLKLDETVFDAVFPDDAHKVKTNLSLDKPISGTQPDTKHAGGKLGLAALVDGKLGTTDDKDSAWLAYPPTEKNIEFVIDLGKPTDVSSVAINLLVNQEAAAHFPSKIDVSTSQSGSDYKHLLGGRSNVLSFDKRARQLNLSKDFKSQACLIFIEGQALAVRYVKVEIVPDTASNSWVFLDEIMVNPVMK